MRRLPHMLLYGIAMASTLSLSTARAMVIETSPDALQRVNASLYHNLGSGPTPPLTPTFPIQKTLQLTPGSTLFVDPPDVYVSGKAYTGGTGIAADAFVNGPAVFYPDVVVPFVGDAWAAASARTGQLRAQAHGSWFEQVRSLPRPNDMSFQFDGLSTSGRASGSIHNAWTFNLDRQALLMRDAEGVWRSNPLHFGITLDVETRFSLNPANATIYLPLPVDPGEVRLNVSISVERLLMVDGSPRPDTLPDGSPSVVTTTQEFAFDISEQGRRTLRFEEVLMPALRWPAPPRAVWVPGVGAITDFQDGLPHSCLEGYLPGTAWGDDCPVRITSSIWLSTSSPFNLAEGSVTATWDASLAGSTAGIQRVVTDADQWGQPLDPSLVLHASMLAPVPEPRAWPLLLAGLGWLVWQRRSVRRDVPIH